MSTKNDRCPERMKLAGTLTLAVTSVYARRREYLGAKDRKEEPFKLSAALQSARDAERAAEHAYSEHVETHNCRH